MEEAHYERVIKSVKPSGLLYDRKKAQNNAEYDFILPLSG